MTGTPAFEHAEGLWMPPETALQSTTDIPLIRTTGSFVHPTAFGCATTPGMGHATCEDAVACGRGGTVLAVCDGIGGAAHGAFAAQVAANVTVDSFERGVTLGAAVEQAGRAVEKLCDWLHSPRTGTTIVAVALHDDRASIAWLGDSLALLLRRGSRELELLTAPDRAGGGNRLSACLGAGSRAAPHLCETRIGPGDVLALCSDGVWTELGRRDLTAILERRWMSARERAELLVRHQPKPTDDATAAVIDVLET